MITQFFLMVALNAYLQAHRFVVQSGIWKDKVISAYFYHQYTCYQYTSHVLNSS